MADVPVWALVLSSTVAVLGTLGGSYVGPHVQRAQRRHELSLEYASRQREKAEEIFGEIERARHDAGASLARHLRNLTSDPLEEPEPDPFNIARLRALVAMYYPSALPILAPYDNTTRHAAKIMREQISKLMESPTKDSVLTMKGVLAMAVAASMQELYPTLDKLHAHMVEAVETFTSAPDRLWN